MAIDCDPNSLAQLAKCFQCLSPATLQQIQAYLLCAISNSATVSGAGNFAGAGSPEGVVTANAGATYVDTVTGSLYWKQTSGGNTGWVVVLTNLTTLGLASITVTNATSPLIDFHDTAGRNFTIHAPSAVQAAFIGSLYAGGTFSLGVNGDLNQIYLDSGGKVGIGNQAPGFALDVTGQTRASTGFLNTSSNVSWTAGAGSPEGVVTAPVGSIYSRTNGGALTSFYVKESGAGNTGWVPK